MKLQFEVRKMNNEIFPIKGTSTYFCSGWGIYNNIDKAWIGLKSDRMQNYPYLVSTEGQARHFLKEMINTNIDIYNCVQ